MASPFISFSVIYGLAFLLPGFITFQITKHIGRIIVEADRFDKAIYTVGASGLSLSAALISYSAVQQGLQITAPKSYAVVEIATIYVLTLVSSVIIGFTAGGLYDRCIHGNKDARRRSAWALTYEHREEPAKVRVITVNEREIWGEIYTNDSDNQGQDLILRYPMQMVRDLDGGVWKYIELGEYVFISGEQISEIYYETELNIEQRT